METYQFVNMPETQLQHRLIIKSCQIKICFEIMKTHLCLKCGGEKIVLSVTCLKLLLL